MIGPECLWGPRHLHGASPHTRKLVCIVPSGLRSRCTETVAMPVVMTVDELESFLAAEFPTVFNPESGLAIEAGWDGGCRVRQAFHELSLRPGGTISGPTMMALADFAMYVAVLAGIGPVPL